MPGVAAIVLAAGGSSRMGTPKQLLTYRGQTFLRRAAENVVAAGCDPSVVVLGSGATEIASELAGLPVVALVNPRWVRGMGTSIKAGMRHVLSMQPMVDAIVIALADQPKITMQDFVRLVESLGRSRRSVAVSRFFSALGPPVCVGRAYFAQLLALPDDSGARAIWRANRDDLIEVPCEAAADDVDTPGDYRELEEGDTNSV